MEARLIWCCGLPTFANWAWAIRYVFTTGRAKGWPMWAQAASIPLPAVVLFMHFLPPRR